MRELRCYGWNGTAPTHAHGYLTEPLIHELTRRVPRGSRVLDLGCGNGALTAVVHRQGYVVVGCDASKDGILLAQERWPEIRFLVAEMAGSPLGSLVGTGFDAVISAEVVEHLIYPGDLFDRAREALKPGGLLLVTTPYHGYLKNLALSVLDGWDRHWDVEWDGGHVKFFSRRTLAALAATRGFRLLGFRGAGRIPWLWKSMICCYELAVRTAPADQRGPTLQAGRK